MPSVGHLAFILLLLLPLCPSVTSFHGRSSSHRSKHLEKSDRRELLRKFRADPVLFIVEVISMDLYSSSSSCKSLSDDPNSINDLAYSLSESLHLNHAKESYSIEDSNDVDEGAKYKDLEVNEITFETLTFEASNKEVNGEIFNENLKRVDVNSTSTCSISLPPGCSQLVSAMKGSREKTGAPHQKMNVSWAADVYDPTPTIISHTVKTKKQQKHSYKYDKGNKKKGKGKEKSNKSSRGSSSKDKKQYRRMTSVSDDNWYKSTNDHEISSVALRGDDGRSDSFCGGSFLMQNLTKVHLPIAEAL